MPVQVQVQPTRTPGLLALSRPILVQQQQYQQQSRRSPKVAMLKPAADIPVDKQQRGRDKKRVTNNNTRYLELLWR